MKHRLFWIKVLVAAVLVAALLSAAQWGDVARSLVDLDRTWLAIALALFIPQTILSALRWQLVARSVCQRTWRDAARDCLAASALNLAVPSKLGDLSKAAMLPVTGLGERARAGRLVVAEKLADVLALLLLCAAGQAGLSAGGWLAGVATTGLGSLAYVGWEWTRGEVGATTGRSPVRPLGWLCLSLGLWFLHLAQIHAFLSAAGVDVSWTVAAARIPLAIFAGLIPLSFCGIGLRDSALIWLFADVGPPSALAAVGLLTALRYLVPGMVGIPVLLGRLDRRIAWDRLPACLQSTGQNDRLEAYPTACGSPQLGCEVKKIPAGLAN